MKSSDFFKLTLGTLLLGSVFAASAAPAAAPQPMHVDLTTQPELNDQVIMAAADMDGDLEAWWDIGVKYQTGDGVKKDLKLAIKWFEKAASRNYDNALVSLGDLYYKGEGVKQSYQKAFELYSRALRRNIPSAQYRLGLCCFYGRGTKQDKKSAVEWFKKAAEQIEPDAQYMLGLCYEKGEGVKQDLKQAKAHYQAAAEADIKEAKEALKRLR